MNRNAREIAVLAHKRGTVRMRDFNWTPSWKPSCFSIFIPVSEHCNCEKVLNGTLWVNNIIHLLSWTWSRSFAFHVACVCIFWTLGRMIHGTRREKCVRFLAASVLVAAAILCWCHVAGRCRSDLKPLNVRCIWNDRHAKYKHQSPESNIFQSIQSYFWAYDFPFISSTGSVSCLLRI